MAAPRAIPTASGDDPGVPPVEAEIERVGDPLGLDHRHRVADERRACDPTDRSMLRDTMISTMPVAMMAIEALWTERFQRLRAVRKSPPDTDVEADPDDGQRGDHAEQAEVDLGRRPEPAPRRRLAAGPVVVVPTSAVMVQPRPRPASTDRRMARQCQCQVLQPPSTPAPCPSTRCRPEHCPLEPCPREHCPRSCRLSVAHGDRTRPRRPGTASPGRSTRHRRRRRGCPG